jgi:hypothetical protein
MAINFPDSPNNGDIFTSNGKKWIYGDGKWSAYGLAIAPDVLKVDSANNRVGVNNLSPSVELDVTGNAAVSGNATVSGSLTVDGDLTISGNTTTLNTTELYVEDNKVTLNSGATGSATANAGIEVERGDDPNVEILWDESADAWKVATDFTVDSGTLHVDSTNNRVGIGDLSPSYTLDVNGQVMLGGGTSITPDSSGNGHLMVGGVGYTGFVSLDNTAMWVGQNSASRKLYLATDETVRVTVDGSGNVGINDTTPSYRLDVNGDINATGDVRVAGRPVGMVLIKTQAVSGTTTVTDAFSSEFANYRIVISGVRDTVNGSVPRLQLGSSSSGYYNGMFLQPYSGGTASLQVNNGNNWYIMVGNTGNNNMSVCIDLYQPNLATRTTFSATGTYNGGAFFAGGMNTATTQFTSFVLASDAGTLSGGTVRVYGYTND